MESLVSAIPSANVSSPKAMAPMKTQMLWSFGTVGRNSFNGLRGASPEKTIVVHGVGRWSVIGFLMTLSNFSGPFVDRMESLCRSCTVVGSVAGGGKEEGQTDQTGETLEGPRDPDGRMELDQDALGGPDVDLQQPRFVQRGVE